MTNISIIVAIVEQECHKVYMLIWHKFQFLRNFTISSKSLHIGKLEKIYYPMGTGIKLAEIF